MSPGAVTDRRRWYEWLLLAVGWGVVVVGAAGAIGSLTHFAGDVPWTRLLIWCVALAAVNDLVVNPLIGGLAWVISRLAPWSARGALAAAGAVSALVVAFSWPRIRGDGRDAGEPSLLAGSAVADVARVVVLVWIVAATVAVVTTIRTRRPRAG